MYAVCDKCKIVDDVGFYGEVCLMCGGKFVSLNGGKKKTTFDKVFKQEKYTPWWMRQSREIPFFQTPVVQDWWGTDTKIVLSYQAYSKLHHYTQSAIGEISGIGKVSFNKSIFRIEDVKIFRQKASSASTSLDTEKLAQFMVELISKGEDHSKWNLWWHTHGNMTAGWSNVDDKNIESHTKDNYLVSICLDKDGQVVGRVDEKSKEANIKVWVEADPQYQKAISIEVNEKVTHSDIMAFHPKKKKKVRR